MDILATIVAVSSVIWYVVDRIKQSYEGLSWGRWLTLGISAILSIASVFCFNLDVMAGLQITEANSIMGQILTVLVLMSGSSGVSEIIQRVRGEKKAEQNQ
mgnify:CR=1 FL=1|jgi:hypothetical protein